MKYLLPLFSVLVLISCTQTTITDGASFVDPGWNGSPANSVVAHVKNAPFGEQQAIENAIVKHLQKRGIKAVASHTLLLPTRDYTRKERQSMLANSGYETRLQIVPYDREIIERYTPPSTRPYGSVGVGSGGYTGVGFGINFGTGYHQEDPIISYRTDLFLIKDNRNLWTSDYSTRGATGMSYEQVGKNFAREILNRLEQDGLI